MKLINIQWLAWVDKISLPGGSPLDNIQWLAWVDKISLPGGSPLDNIQWQAWVDKDQCRHQQTLLISIRIRQGRSLLFTKKFTCTLFFYIRIYEVFNFMNLVLRWFYTLFRNLIISNFIMQSKFKFTFFLRKMLKFT